MLCGDGCPAFVREDVIRFTEPKLGYSRDSPAFEKFVNVLVGFNAKERKAFLQFTTGCSSLPPGKHHFGRNTSSCARQFFLCYVTLLLSTCYPNVVNYLIS